MSTKTCLALAAVTAMTGCSSTTVVHHAVSSARGSAERAEFGVGKTSVAERALGRSSDMTDVRVEHGADVAPSGVDRFWRVTLDAGDEGAALRMQHLELCTGTPGAPRACERARVTGANGKDAELVGSFPSLLEAGNRGASLRMQQTSQTGGMVVAGAGGVSFVSYQINTSSRSGGDLVPPVGHAATPAFGVWALTEAAGVAPTVLGAGLVRTGALFFCHAPPPLSAPRCVAAPGVVDIDKILAVHLLRRGGALRHVVWAESMTGPLTARVGTIVRCEAGDLDASPTCVPAEVH